MLRGRRASGNEIEVGEEYSNVLLSGKHGVMNILSVVGGKS